MRRGRLGSEHFVRPLTLQGLSQQIYIMRAVWLGVLEEPSCLTNNFLQVCRAEMEWDGTRKRTGGEVKGKKGNGRGSQQSCTVSDTVYPALLSLMRTPRLPAADWTDTPADINGLVRFAEKPNLVSARVPSRSVSALQRGTRVLAPIWKHSQCH